MSVSAELNRVAVSIGAGLVVATLVVLVAFGTGDAARTSSASTAAGAKVD